MPWIASSPLIRLTCWIRSLINRPRSRCSRRSSSSATLGTRTTLQTFGSPRRYAVCFEQAVEPEAVVASFVARNDFHALLRFSGNARPDPLAQIQEFLAIAGLQREATDLVRQGRVDGNNPTFLA